jgi:hypothetical protein
MDTPASARNWSILDAFRDCGDVQLRLKQNATGSTRSAYSVVNLPATAVCTEHVARMDNTMHLHDKYLQRSTGSADVRYSLLCQAAGSSLQCIKNRLAGDDAKQAYVHTLPLNKQLHVVI